jgi:hypothetical protein
MFGFFEGPKKSEPMESVPLNTLDQFGNGLQIREENFHEIIREALEKKLDEYRGRQEQSTAKFAAAFHQDPAPENYNEIEADKLFDDYKAKMMEEFLETGKINVDEFKREHLNDDQYNEEQVDIAFQKIKERINMVLDNPSRTD